MDIISEELSVHVVNTYRFEEDFPTLNGTANDNSNMCTPKKGNENEVK